MRIRSVWHSFPSAAKVWAMVRIRAAKAPGISSELSLCVVGVIYGMTDRGTTAGGDFSCPEFRRFAGRRGSESCESRGLITGVVFSIPNIHKEAAEAMGGSITDDVAVRERANREEGNGN